MSNTAIQPPVITASDRLFLTIFLAVIIHGLIILGITFSQNLSENKTPPTLDVILVNNTNELDKAQEQVDFIANVNQLGGGDVDENAHPRSPFTALEQSDAQGIAPIPIKAATNVNVELKFQEIISTFSKSNHTVSTQEKKQDEKKKVEKNITFEHDLEMAQLMNEINDDLDRHAKRPRKSFISARTKSAVSAEYMYKWIKKVERIGNLNYPEKARKQNLKGNLILVVAINQDGSLYKLTIRQSSGSSILDIAAKNIVKMAAPFAKFSDNLRKKVDILYITRTWQFHSNTLTSNN